MDSSSLTTPAFPSLQWKYDVFLSFRGLDTRRSITSELYYQLQKRGIKTFMDEQDLRVGDEISTTLVDAIEASRFAIVVLSKEYASSSWCLEELTKICQFLKDNNRILPLFYQVNPTNVRYQKRTFKQAFTKHGKFGRQRSDKLQQWRYALKKVASFSGWNSNDYKTDRQLAEKIVEVVCTRVGPIEIKTRDFEAKKQKLELMLLSANLLVDDAEEKQIRKPEVKNWLVELKDTLYHARDLLDEIKTEDLRRKLEGSSHPVQNFNPTSFDEFDKALESKMDDICKTLSVIMDQKDVLGLKAGNENWPKSRTRETTSLVDDSGVYGRDEDKETIKKLLLSDDATDEKIGVIPIVGMGGIGKTTLAQLLYNDVKGKFQLHAWVCVSEEFDLLRVTQAIYGSITKQACNIIQLDLLQVKLKESLGNKKFLIVLDDIWNENYDDWDALKRPFDSGAFGSRIIITTRNKKVASMMCTLESCNLKQISVDDCWLIFAKHAFGSKPHVLGSEHRILVEIGKEIAMKCNGVPLSAKSLGGLLRSEVSKEKWERILESDLWHMSEKGIDIFPALWISYRHLPSHLKRCFAYCSVFPKDYQFRKSELMRMWMAEDLLQPEKQKMMEVGSGEDYFDTLISRSFFEPVPGWESHFRESYFTMHDLINDLAKYVSGDFCWRLEDEYSLVDVSKTRHFSYMKADDDSKRFVALYKAKSLHTFTSFNLFDVVEMPKVLNDLLPTFHCLRFLNLSRYNIKELPSSIDNLKHLRHLDLSGTSIKHLPDTLCTLCNLQTLLLRECSKLVQLPTNLGRLVNLRCLDVSFCKIQKMPPRIGGLKDLQLLSDFVVGKDDGGSVAELKELHHLGGTLCISGLENIVSDKDALEANMRCKKNMNELILEWTEGVTSFTQRERLVLEQLQPHTNLKSLKIFHYRGTKFPNWVGDHSFSNLVSVQLEDCEFCISLPPLGQLPSLEKLCIEGLKGLGSIGSELYRNNSGGVQPFRSLKSLEIGNMLEWQEWVYEEFPIFPNLKKLHLWACPKLTNTFPLDKFPKLEEVWLNDLESFGGPLSQEPECPKFLSLATLYIEDCPEFEHFPGGGIDAPELKTLYIKYCVKFGSLPERMHTLLPSLTYLEIRDCPELESFPEGGLPPALERLSITGDNTKLLINRDQWGLHGLKNLRSFTFGWDEGLLLEEELLPTTLTHLELICPYLRTIDGRQFRHLNSLQSLSVAFCHELECFPEEGLPTSLKELSISFCPLLEERCQRGNGQEWHKIAHIPYISLNSSKI